MKRLFAQAVVAVVMAALVIASAFILAPLPPGLTDYRPLRLPAL